MNINRADCGTCRYLGSYAPWSFLIVAAIIAMLPLGEAWQRSSAYLGALALFLLFASYVLKRATPGRRKF